MLHKHSSHQCCSSITWIRGFVKGFDLRELSNRKPCQRPYVIDRCVKALCLRPVFPGNAINAVICVCVCGGVCCCFEVTWLLSLCVGVGVGVGVGGYILLLLWGYMTAVCVCVWVGVGVGVGVCVGGYILLLLWGYMTAAWAAVLGNAFLSFDDLVSRKRLVVEWTGHNLGFWAKVFRGYFWLPSILITFDC